MQSLYDISKQLAEAGFPQPKPAFGQFWFDSLGSALTVVYIRDSPNPIVEFAEHAYGNISRADIGISAIWVYQPTVEDIMPLLPSYLSLECDVDRETGEVTWSVEVRRNGRIMEWDLAWRSPRNIKHPVIACALAWLHLNSKPA